MRGSDREVTGIRMETLSSHFNSLLWFSEDHGELIETM